MYRNVVIAYDATDGAKAALDRAVEIASRDGGALNLVESVPEEVMAHLPVGRDASPEDRARAREELRSAVEAIDPSLEPSPWVVGGPPAKAILAVADDIRADLIVTGSRARGPIERAVLGSVSTEILHNAPCDVLVVHPRA